MIFALLLLKNYNDCGLYSYLSKIIFIFLSLIIYSAYLHAGLTFQPSRMVNDTLRFIVFYLEARLLALSYNLRSERMALTAGIVGLPNVGKSTLFNAITQAGAESANYPFCTIDPNVGVVEVPDARLNKLTELVQPKKTVPTTFEFTDIAGIVKGASKGEGLGNKFLSHIREVDAICQVVRCFEDDNITHVAGKVDPIDDIETINLELILADLESVEKRIGRVEKLAKQKDKEAVIEFEVLFKS